MYCVGLMQLAVAVSTGITALHAAVQKEGHLDVVVALLEHGADVDCTTAKGNTALM
jgi:ankyrin repeat protein